MENHKKREDFVDRMCYYVRIKWRKCGSQMSNQQKIAQYIDNLSFKKSVFGKVSANDVQEIVCDISSMYNEMLEDVYHENERLKRLIDDMDENSEEEPADYSPEDDYQDESCDLMQDTAEMNSENIEEKEEPVSPGVETGLANKELKKFKRTELLEILLDQSKENEQQKKKIEELQQTVAKLQAQLEDRTLRINKAGTIAEAAFALNGVYDSTQAAAQQYLDGLEKLYERERQNCIEKEARTEAYVKMLLEETEKACEQKEKRMADRCAALEQATRERCEFMKEEVQKRCLEIEERARVRCEMREKEAERKCKELDRKAQTDVEKRWDSLSKRLEEFYHSHDGLREKLANTGESQNK